MKIRITKIPQGDSPYWIRKEMLNLEFQADTSTQAAELLQKMGASLGEIITNIYIVVRLPELLRVLRVEGLEDAALWLEQNDQFKSIQAVIFKKKYCQLLP